MEERDAPRHGDLTSLQRWLADAVRHPEPCGAGDPRSADAGARVLPSARGMTPEQRVEVYREQYWLRHLGSLTEDFPTLIWVLGGQEAFRELAGEYLLAHPPRTWDLQRLGADLPAFVHARGKGGAMGADAARLDWAFMEVFDAPDSPPLDPASLAAIPESAWSSARVELRAALRLVRLEHPLHEARERLKQGLAPEAPAPRGAQVVVWRDAACFPHAAEVEDAAFDLLSALQRGEALGPACEAVAASGKASGPVDELVGAWFQDWTSRAWVSAVRA